VVASKSAEFQLPGRAVRFQSRSEHWWPLKILMPKRGIQICKMTTPDSILPPMTQFDALHAQKYPHVYDQSAIAD